LVELENNQGNKRRSSASHGKADPDGYEWVEATFQELAFHENTNLIIGSFATTALANAKATNLRKISRNMLASRFW